MPRRSRIELNVITVTTYSRDLPEESGHTRAECTTGCTIGNGADPCQLGLVDSEMRAGGAFKTLSIQDFL